MHARGGEVHGLHARTSGVGKSWQGSATPGKQSQLPLISSMSRTLVSAPNSVVRQLESAAQALDVAMQASGAKGAYIAACIGKSEAYVSRMRSGKRPIPDKLIPALCQATGSNLLRQWVELQAALADDSTARLVALMRSAA
jgi:DNA-binding transcriptional regulator YdaS (Cro superfamily)